MLFLQFSICLEIKSILKDLEQKQVKTNLGQVTCKCCQENCNTTDSIRKQILFANYLISNSGPGLTGWLSMILMLTQASSNIIIKPKRGTHLLLKSSICLCILLHQIEPLMCCCLRKDFRTNSQPTLFLAHMPTNHWKRLDFSTILQKTIPWEFAECSQC